MECIERKKRNVKGGEMNTSADNQGSRMGVASCTRPSHLRLIVSVGERTAPRAPSRWTVSTIACPSRLSWITKQGTARGSPIDHKRRPEDRQKEKGKTMELKDRLIADVGRFVFGLGIGIALTSAYVVVTSAPDLLGTPVAADVVRLDPVIVTASKQHVDAVRDEADEPAPRKHVFGAGPKQV
jgi:hypothetical protein